MEPIIGVLVIAALFVARFALPMALTLAFSYGMNRYLARSDRPDA
jgi:hypothetical protein